MGKLVESLIAAMYEAQGIERMIIVKHIVLYLEVILSKHSVS